MAPCYPEGPLRERPFIVTPYVASPGGGLIAELPAVCLHGAYGDEHPCSLSIHHHRERKTGPRHPLAVAACRTHGICFTLYPPGHRPWGRQPVVRLAPDGQELAGETAPEAAFTDTPFEAAFDASEGRAWAREPADPPAERWWSTQGRHLALAAELVGVAEALSDRLRESIAAALSVGALLLREHSRARGYRQLGAAVCAVLDELRPGPKRSRQLLACGHLVGRWGEPLHWDPRRRAHRRAPFPAGLCLDST
jgi:hypothetical protein